MRIFLSKLLNILGIIGLLGVIAYLATTNLPKIKDLLFPPEPCERPISYSLDTIDLRFNVSTTELISILNQAANIWEQAANKDLFVYVPEDTGTVKINLLYDYRQKTTKDLQTLNTVIDRDQTTYDGIKLTYDNLIRSYDQQKLTFEQHLATFKRNQAEYEQQVQYWNKKGGAPRDEYRNLEQRRQSLNVEAENIKREQDALNSLIPTIRSTENELNALAKKLNLTVSNFNTTASSVKEEFNEGEYISDSEGERINIYQFDTKEKLLRVMIHELGHALGLDHNDNPQAIMYRLNSGSTVKLATEDVASLKQLCKLTE